MTKTAAQAEPREVGGVLDLGEVGGRIKVGETAARFEPVEAGGR